MVNFKVNQYLYSLRLLLSSISSLSLSFLPSSLSSSRARLICIHSHFKQFLCPFLPASQAFLLESFPFKSFLRFFFHKSLFLYEKPPPTNHCSWKTVVLETQLCTEILRDTSPQVWRDSTILSFPVLLLNISAESLVFVPL